MRQDLWEQVLERAAGAVLADGMHLPFAVVAIELCHDLGRVVPLNT